MMMLVEIVGIEVVKHVVMVIRMWHLIWDFISSKPIFRVVKVLSSNCGIFKAFSWRCWLLRFVMVV